MFANKRFMNSAMGSWTGICLLALLPMAGLSRPLAKSDGPHYVLSLNAGYAESQGQFDTDSDNAITPDLNNRGQTSDKLLLMPLFKFDYTFNDQRSQIFIGNSAERILNSQFQYELGFHQQWGKYNQFTFAYIPHIPVFKETWEDPFLVGEARSETGQFSQAFRVAYRYGLISLKYAVAMNEIETERSGAADYTEQEQALLRRDGRYDRLTAEVMLPLAKGFFLKPILYVAQRDAEGESTSFDEINARLSLVARMDRHFIALQGAYGIKDYAVANPVFDVVQQDDAVSVMLLYSYAEAFNFEPLKFNVIVSARDVDSNIEFYEQRSRFISAGFSYEF